MGAAALLRTAADPARSASPPEDEAAVVAAARRSAAAPETDELEVRSSAEGRPLSQASRERLPAALHSAPRAQTARLEDGARCGVVMMALGQDYVALATAIANRTTQLSAVKGWCSLDPDLDHVPVTLFTDLNPTTLWREVNLLRVQSPKAVGASALSIRHISELPPWAGPTGSAGLQEHLGSWRMRWYHAQTILAVPYRIVIYLDVDAIPCTSHGVTRLIEKVRQRHASFGAPMVHESVKCGTSAGDCSSPHPEGLGDDELAEWASFTERNSGVMVLDMLTARPVVEDFARGIVRNAGNVSGDQFALREALFMHRRDVRQVTFTDDEVCRYKSPWQAPCESDTSTGCAIHHLPRMGSLKIIR